MHVNCGWFVAGVWATAKSGGYLLLFLVPSLTVRMWSSIFIYLRCNVQHPFVNHTLMCSLFFQRPTLVWINIAFSFIKRGKMWPMLTNCQKQISRRLHIGRAPNKIYWKYTVYISRWISNSSSSNNNGLQLPAYQPPLPPTLRRHRTNIMPNFYRE